jgi:lipoate-protein ligase A
MAIGEEGGAAACRLILSGPGDPAWNMALDEVLFRGCLAGGQPFLRFYGWDPPGLSLGRFQRDLSAIDLDFCRRAGIAVVRRLTGGRAVLHHRELTYSIGARFEPPFEETGVVAVYRRIAAGLAAGLALLGLDADWSARRRRPAGRSANCFAAVSRCELTWGGRKLVGSAQVRERGGFLQHGSILLELDAALWRGVFGGADPAGAAVPLCEALGRQIGEAEAAAAVTRGLAGSLGLLPSPGGLTSTEASEAEALARTTRRIHS